MSMWSTPSAISFIRQITRRAFDYGWNLHLGGGVLTDYTNAMGVGEWSPSWWEPGKPVAVRVHGGVTDFTAGEDDLPDCEV